VKKLNLCLVFGTHSCQSGRDSSTYWNLGLTVTSRAPVRAKTGASRSRENMIWSKTQLNGLTNFAALRRHCGVSGFSRVVTCRFKETTRGEVEKHVGLVYKLKPSHHTRSTTRPIVNQLRRPTARLLARASRTSSSRLFNLLQQRSLKVHCNSQRHFESTLPPHASKLLFAETMDHPHRPLVPIGRMPL